MRNQVPTSDDDKHQNGDTWGAGVGRRVRSRTLPAALSAQRVTLKVANAGGPVSPVALLGTACIL